MGTRSGLTWIVTEVYPRAAQRMVVVAGFRFLHDLDGGGAGNERSERKRLLASNSREQEADRIGDGQAIAAKTPAASFLISPSTRPRASWLRGMTVGPWGCKNCMALAFERDRWFRACGLLVGGIVFCLRDALQ